MSPFRIDRRTVVRLCQQQLGGMALLLIIGLTPLSAQQSVQIKREPLQLQPASKFQVSLSLQPHRTQIIAAPSAGTVLSVSVKRGDRVSASATCATLDDSRQKLVVSRVRALVEVARGEVRQAEELKKIDLAGISKSRLQAVEADLQIALYDLERLTCKSSFSGLATEVFVEPGQFVRQGEPLVKLIDLSKLTVELPVDRLQVKVDSELEFLIDQGARRGRVQALLPPTHNLESLRPILPGLATALVSVENTQGDLLAGQTVFSRLVPQFAVCDVPVSAVSNHTEGRRKVQVLRSGIIREIVVETLTQRGADRVFVTGGFLPQDELIVSSTVPLKDGQRLQPSTASAVATTPATSGDGSPASNSGSQPPNKGAVDPGKGF